MNENRLTIIFGVLVIIINVLFDLSHLAQRLMVCFSIVLIITVIILAVYVSIVTIKEIKKELKDGK